MYHEKDWFLRSYTFVWFTAPFTKLITSQIARRKKEKEKGRGLDEGRQRILTVWCGSFKKLK